MHLRSLRSLRGPRLCRRLLRPPLRTHQRRLRPRAVNRGFFVLVVSFYSTLFSCGKSALNFLRCPFVLSINSSPSPACHSVVLIQNRASALITSSFLSTKQTTIKKII